MKHNSYKHKKKAYFLAVLLAIGALTYALTAQAATRTWDGGGTRAYAILQFPIYK